MDRAGIEAAVTRRGRSEARKADRSCGAITGSGHLLAGTLHDKLQQWAPVVGADPAPLSATLAKPRNRVRWKPSSPRSPRHGSNLGRKPFQRRKSVAAVPVPAVPGPEPESELRDLFLVDAQRIGHTGRNDKYGATALALSMNMSDQ
ncbi:MAG: hypothetical protein IPI02_18585 [Sterolibacteriaceae bacterium]|nr:hypothetical protein [Sterolibacteriaceae bacterium]